jgi:hypothetical protein
MNTRNNLRGVGPTPIFGSWTKSGEGPVGGGQSDKWRLGLGKGLSSDRGRDSQEAGSER